MASSSSARSNKEAAQKKKLQKFLREMVNFGTLRGFKHFSCYVRGKEELLITVNNKLPGSSNSSLFITSSAPSPVYKKPLCPTDSFSSSNLPYDKNSLVLSNNAQVGLSEKKDQEIGLPPASPSEDERKPEADVTLFLIAGYARYCCPYVWVRSNHERLFKLSGDQDDDKDSPLRLKSTARWKDEDVRVMEIVGEIVKLCTFPAPRNPFEVDLDYFRFLSQPDQLLASAAMVTWLQKILLHTPDSKAYIAKVFEEQQLISKLHFNSFREVTLAGKLPIFQQHQRKRSQQQPSQGKAVFPGTPQQITAPPMSQVRAPQVTTALPVCRENSLPPSMVKPQVQKLPLSRQPAVDPSFMSGSAAPPLTASTPTLNSPLLRMPTTPLLLVTPPNKPIPGPTLPTTVVQNVSSDGAPQSAQVSRPFGPRTTMSATAQHLPLGFPPNHAMSRPVQTTSIRPQSVPFTSSNAQVTLSSQEYNQFSAPPTHPSKHTTFSQQTPALYSPQQNPQMSHMTRHPQSSNMTAPTQQRPQSSNMAAPTQQHLQSHNMAPPAQARPQPWGQTAMQPSQAQVQRPFYQPAPTAQPSVPSNPVGVVYGSGPRGAFPGGFDRMPAPSML
ncbi:unnamed protein product [Lymnaea stagnalis]|uniref:DUF7886 domain-containing protein n=1 Tax=Lymnaea stagnalis TaxID=6523 RepID=A0AAV2H8G2_LYMST